MTIIVPPTQDANSFTTLAEANDYHDNRLHNSEWGLASDPDKETGLIMATRLLRQFNNLWVDDNIRLGTSISPDYLIQATAEYAWLLLIKDTTREDGTKGFKSLSVGPISLAVDKYDRTKQVPSAVLDIISPYLRKQGNLLVVRG